MQVLRHRRAHAGAEPGGHDDGCDRRVGHVSGDGWLGRQDSNLGSRDQNPLPYRLATPHCGPSIGASRRAARAEPAQSLVALGEQDDERRRPRATTIATIAIHFAMKSTIGTSTASSLRGGEDPARAAARSSSCSCAPTSDPEADRDDREQRRPRDAGSRRGGQEALDRRDPEREPQPVLAQVPAGLRIRLDRARSLRRHRDQTLPRWRGRASSRRGPRARLPRALGGGRVAEEAVDGRAGAADVGAERAEPRSRRERRARRGRSAAARPDRPARPARATRARARAARRSPSAPSKRRVDLRRSTPCAHRAGRSRSTA